MNISELRQTHPDHWMKAAALRVLSMDAVQKANSGHPGLPMGMADVATVLFERHLKFDAAAPPGLIGTGSSFQPATGRCCSMHSFT